MSVISKIHQSDVYKVINDISVAHWIISSLVALGSGGVTIMRNHDIEWAIPCFLAVLVLSLWVIHYWKGAAKHKPPNHWGFLVPVLALGVLVAFWYAEYVPVYGPFRHVYRDYERRLGKPTGEWRFGKDNVKNDRDNITYQGLFQNGTHIWSLQGFYVMFADGSYVKESQMETADGDWQNEKKMEELFKPPPGFGPPFGSLAKAWKKWSKLGWREWQCGTEPNVAYQDFENGRMIGVLRNRPTKQWDAGLIYILFFKNGEDGSGEFQTSIAPHAAPDGEKSGCIVP